MAKLIIPQLWLNSFDEEKSEMILFPVTRSLMEGGKVDFDSFLGKVNMEDIEHTDKAHLVFSLTNTIIPILPSIYLFLKALHEDNDQETQDDVLSIYNGVAEALKKHPDFKVDITFDSEGNLFNEGVLVMHLNDVKLAEFIFIVSNAYQDLNTYSLLKKIRPQTEGYGVVTGANRAMEKLGAFGGMLVGDDKMDASKEIYFKAKALLPELEWDITATIQELIA